MRKAPPIPPDADRNPPAQRFAEMLALVAVGALLAVAGMILLQALARWLGLAGLPTALADLRELAAPLALALCLPLAGGRAIAVRRPGMHRSWVDGLAGLLLMLAAGALVAYARDLAPRRTIIADWPLAPVFMGAGAGYLLAAIMAWRRR